MTTRQKLELTWFNKDKALIPTETGKYGYTWVDVNDPRYCETHYLDVCETVNAAQLPKDDGTTYSERADLPPQDDNLLILGESGDVLEALTREPSLRDKYVGKVKCVYIDPPFNTAQTFANYEDNLEHSVWLTMMRDRLVHLRNLLCEDGSIWVHLDDVENHRMRMLLDEVFGASNYIAEMQWEKTYSPRNDSKGIPMVTDTILVYGASTQFTPNRLPRTAEMNSRYSNPDNDIRGPWKSGDTSAPGNMSGKMQHPGVYGIQHPVTGAMIYPSAGRHWNFGQQKMKALLEEFVPLGFESPTPLVRSQMSGLSEDLIRSDVADLVLAGEKEDSNQKAVRRIREGNWPDVFFTIEGIGRKVPLALAEGRMPANFLPWDEVGHTDSAAKEIRNLFPGTTAFATPKPERLLERIIHIATNPGDIVLDVFAGSGTTAAVAQKMGRRWVTCELVEDTFERFTKARLTKVVNGEDMGGISTAKGERVDATENGLPEGMTPEQAQAFTSALNKLVSVNAELKKDATVKTLKLLAKTTKTKDTVNYRGGGGFTVAKLSPACFDFNPALGLVTLTDSATGSVLVKSVAANLGFYLTPDHLVFDGQFGRQFLAVVEGVLTNEKVDDLMAHLPDNHSILFAATILGEDVRQHVRDYKNGSRVVHIPFDLFPYTTAPEEA